MSDPEPARASQGLPPKLVLGLLVAALLINLWSVTRCWNTSIRDAFETRQAQTALSAYYLKKDGLRLDYQTPLLGPPWSVPMEFPLYQMTVAGLSTLTGMALEPSGRLMGLLFFYATLPAIWLLVGRCLPQRQDRLLVLASVLLCPTFLFYSRTFMIESTALCLVAWYLVAFDAALRHPFRWSLLLAWAVGALAACTKVTSFAASWIALGLLCAAQVRALTSSGLPTGRALRRSLAHALLALSVPIALGAVWVLYSDHLKELNPYGHSITSTSLREFNLGTLTQRLSAEWWRQMAAASLRILNLPGVIITLLGTCFIPRVYRNLSLACLLSFPGGLLVFANLYSVHDYYFYASAAFLVTAFGVTVAGLMQTPRLPALLGLLLAVLGLGLQVRSFQQTYYRYFYQEHIAPPPPIEAEISRLITPPEDVVAGFGLDWNGLYPYYAERRGLMVFESHTKNFDLLDQSLARLGQQHIGTVLVARWYRKEYPFIGDLRAKLELTREPIAQTADIDIYVRRDLARAATTALQAYANRPGLTLNLDRSESGPVFKDEHDLRAAKWQGRLPQFSPAPFISKGPIEIGVLGLDGQEVVNTHAPVEIHFQPPPGSRTIEAITGMLPGSYTGKGSTPGIRLVVAEQLPEGSRRILFERVLTPLTRPKDRGDVPIHYMQDKPFTGTLVFAQYDTGDGDFSYCWCYWKSIVIR